MYDTTKGAKNNDINYKQIIFFTDGLSSDRHAVYEAARDLRAGNAKIYVIGQGQQVDQLEVLGVAGNLDHVFSTENQDATYAIMKESSHENCTGTYILDLFILICS